MALAHASPGEIIHLPRFASVAGELKTTALVKTDGFETVHLVLKSGTRIAPHAVQGYFTLHCLEGAVALETDDRAITLHSGDWLYLERGERHGLAAAEDSSLLLTILFEGNGSDAMQS